jgi:hypothetical protein
MINLNQLEEQMARIDFKKSGLWGHAKVKELCKVLHEGEEVKHCVNGYYEDGFAMLAATDQRLVVIDRKPMFLTIQAIWYDKIGQVDFSRRLMNATLHISTPNQNLTFSAWNHQRLHEVLDYSQKRMADYKNASRQSESTTTAANIPLEQPLAPQSPQPSYYASYSLNYNPGYTQPSPVGQQPPTQWPVGDANTRQRVANAKLPFTHRRYFAR